jgi:hypothetical protein
MWIRDPRWEKFGSGIWDGKKFGSRTRDKHPGSAILKEDVSPPVQESGSISSTVSDASTEPWFCEPCRANLRDPPCQVCPNVGGIYKVCDA